MYIFIMLINIKMIKCDKVNLKTNFEKDVFVPTNIHTSIRNNSLIR